MHAKKGERGKEKNKTSIHWEPWIITGLDGDLKGGKKRENLVDRQADRRDCRD